MPGLSDRVREHVQNLSDEELIAYILTGEEAYEPEAVEFAKEEFKRRKLDPKIVETIDTEARANIEADRAAKAEAAERELDFIDCVRAFFLGATIFGVMSLARADAVFQNAGERRKSAEMWRWAFTGMMTVVVMIAVGVVYKILTSKS